jgi:hypothetical protein
MTPSDLIAVTTKLLDEVSQGIHVAHERSSFKKEVAYLRRLWDLIISRCNFGYEKVPSELTRVFFIGWSVAHQRHGDLVGRVNVCLPQQDLCAVFIKAYNEYAERDVVMHPAQFVTSVERDSWGKKDAPSLNVNPRLLMLTETHKVMSSFADMSAMVSVLNRQDHCRNGCVLFSTVPIDFFDPVVKDGKHYDYTMLNCEVCDPVGILKEVSGVKS